MFDKPNVYKMKPGEYVEDKDIEDIADGYFGDDPIIDYYEVGIYETDGDKKNHLYFEYDLIDLERMVEEFDPEDHERTTSNINKFLEEVTGRTAKHRREDMKKQTKED